MVCASVSDEYGKVIILFRQFFYAAILCRAADNACTTAPMLDDLLPSREVVILTA